MNITIKDLVKDTFADFVCYRDGDLWYRISFRQAATDTTDKDSSFEFPVPVNDTGSGVFPARLKAITLMRWIRKHHSRIEAGEWSL